MVVVVVKVVAAVGASVHGHWLGGQCLLTVATAISPPTSLRTCTHTDTHKHTVSIPNENH